MILVDPAGQDAHRARPAAALDRDAGRHQAEHPGTVALTHVRKTPAGLFAGAQPRRGNADQIIVAGDVDLVVICPVDHRGRDKHARDFDRSFDTVVDHGGSAPFKPQAGSARAAMLAV
ncbi:MAG: hypothetical protein EOP61_39850 [Sphingomonadales bacterium]|nr:MAG: hypothetical protein EOP61_39850 [Sphingomonadales bacterium]